ncbi:MAG: mannose-6-phosphate isomerase, class I [Microbacteriaceae bacterium]|nr:MAG: mannose-6-phosphate isomerase, class I [Microbacteriaceae bacterium]
MFVRIDNAPRDYAWGSTTAIARLLGRPTSGRPEAELWFGAHPGSPSRIAEPALTGGATNLAEWIARDPRTALGSTDAGGPAPGAGTPNATGSADAAGGSASGAGARRGAAMRRAPHLTFLLKVLAAAAPLSLQAHPSSVQAAEGYERENAAGVPLDSPDRNYKDPFHKPELVFALSERFEALCGFRPLAGTIVVLDRLIAAAADAMQPTDALTAFRARLAVQTDAPQILRGTVAWLLESGGDGADAVRAVVAEVVDAAARVVASAESAVTAAVTDDLLPFTTVGVLASAYPGDPGIVLSLLLNRVSLKRGEALYLPAGNIHAYLHGLGIELMSASDNVLRGGLTPKHIDVPELLHVLHFTPKPVPYLRPDLHGDNVEVFRPDVPDFRLVRVALGTDADDLDSTDARVELSGPAIALCTDGGVRLRGLRGEVTLRQGEAAYVTPDEASVTVVGDGTVFVATSNE